MVGRIHGALVMTLTLSALCSWCLPSVNAAVESGEIRALIALLGAPSHAEREHATDALWRIGSPARELLSRAAASDDPEIGLRARGILSDIEHGIRPAWPVELREQVRGYASSTTIEKQALVTQLLNERPEQAMPFMLMCLGKGEAGGATFVVNQLKQLAADAEIWESWRDAIREPTNSYEAHVLALACQRGGDVPEMARALASPFLDAGVKRPLVNSAVESLHQLREGAAYDELRQSAARLAEGVPDDARLLYLQATAELQLGEVGKAAALRQAALALHPDDEAPHYTAGELLMKLGQLSAAELEWKRILTIPPEGDVYDLNAHMRLGAIYAQTERYGKAADAYEMGLKAYQAAKAKAGSGMGLIGASIEELTQRVHALRQKAAGGQADAMAVEGESLQISLDVSVKEGQLEAMRRALNGASATIKATVQPHGLRLLEKTSATVQVDPVTQKFSILLNGSPCTEPVLCELKEPSSTLVLELLDMFYLYSVEKASGATEQVAAYEKDYRLRIVPTAQIGAWGQPTITLNGKAHTWEDLRAGIAFDFLPPKLVLDVEGVLPSGERGQLSCPIGRELLKVDIAGTKGPVATRTTTIRVSPTQGAAERAPAPQDLEEPQMNTDERRLGED